MGNAIDEVYASSLLDEMENTPNIDQMLYLMERPDIEGKVLSIQDLRKFGFIDEYTNKYLSENYKINDENETYIDLKAFSLYEWFSGEAGDIVLYQKQQNSLTRLLPTYPSINPATSWASPNALSEDVLQDFGHH